MFLGGKSTKIIVSSLHRASRLERGHRRCKIFMDLPVEAKNYVRKMITSICEVAYGENWANKRLPELLYIGVGPNPGQVIQNLPPVVEILDFLKYLNF